MGAMILLENFALDVIEDCIDRGAGRTSTAQLSFWFTVRGVDTTPDEAADIAKQLGYRVTKRRLVVNGKLLVSKWVQHPK